VRIGDVDIDGSADRRAFTSLLFENVSLSYCYACKGVTVWVADRIVDPTHVDDIEPQEDMPDDVLLDFREASSIVGVSPRGAAALLRLAIQKLMPHLGLLGKNLNEDIGTLVGKGLDTRIQQALDVVRVIGNNAVHPGQIDLRDDKATALRLFALVNIVVESMISARNHIKEMFESLPEGAKKQIAERDQN
jgi:Domain of unknown function (DUF4145)